MSINNLNVVFCKIVMQLKHLPMKVCVHSIVEYVFKRRVPDF